MQFIPQKSWQVDSIRYSVMEGPFGLLGLATTTKGVCNLRSTIPDESDYRSYLERIYGVHPTKDSGALKSVQEELEAYFEGTLSDFQCAIDTSFGTPFQQTVWNQLKEIPYGQTRSYRWLARAVGNPRACRAVGSANGKNPLPIILPCHRVIASDGGLGGYTSGLSIKRYLLELEQSLHAAV